jgi:hypothetical protein
MRLILCICWGLFVAARHLENSSPRPGSAKKARNWFANLFEIREFWRIESAIDSKPRNQGSNSIRFAEIRELRTFENSCGAVADRLTKPLAPTAFAKSRSLLEIEALVTRSQQTWQRRRSLNIISHEDFRVVLLRLACTALSSIALPAKWSWEGMLWYEAGAD